MTGNVAPDRKDNFGETPLLEAISTACKSHEIVERLPAADVVDPSIVNREGKTPLILASSEGDLTTVKLLDRAGQVKDSQTGMPDYARLINIDMKDDYGWTALNYAAVRGRRDIVELLLKIDAVNTNSKVPEGNYLAGAMAFSIAVSSGEDSVVDLLLSTENVDLDTADENGRTPLSPAAQFGFTSILETLLGTGKVDQDSKSNLGRTPLSYAAEEGNLGSVKALIKAGADCNLEDQDGLPPLFYAVRSGANKVVEVFLEIKDVQIQHEARDGRNLLCLAAAGNECYATFKLLLSMGGGGCQHS